MVHAFFIFIFITMKKIFLLLTFLLCTHVAWANKVVEVEGINYCIDVYDKIAYVTGGKNYTGSVVILSSIEVNGITYPVTSLGPYCFKNCATLTSINIPNSVTWFLDNCFEGCTGLSSITIPNSVKGLGQNCFLNCI